jgi:uncharacterized protein YegP (UPF0339 family)
MKTPAFEVFQSARGKQPWRWRLRGANGEIVCQSEGYVSRYNARRAARRLVEIAWLAVSGVQPQGEGK